ncbi:MULTISPECIES: hypothetical protein [Maribacter]|uniref:Uncharacterized protein n=1 Tax=Maribacter flavus TaxID=1658664 RepID=A0ABU7IE23_9FLAO|nr:MULTISPECIES: hypothetical protein [Maribacter]MDC6404055.1 hypothetical protein [Maribacter sp. PR66]MEE1971196.1 hypothetical protein [Maribacter flavus]
MRTIEFLYILLLSCLFDAEAQQKNNPLFESKEILPLQLSYTNKQIKKETNKEKGIHTNLLYKQGQNWDTLPISLRARGNFRRNTCYFTPLKIYFKRGGTQSTPFENHKNVKIVLPCLLEDRSNDDVLKEYLAYKMYELLSPIHFKTRLATLEYTDTRGEKDELHPLAIFLNDSKNSLYNDEGAWAARKAKNHTLLTILIEDDKVVARRHDAKVLKRFVHPLNQEETISIINAFFQFMIGNTDFSTAYSHNQKLIFKEGKSYPIPYDFDMSGLVNASYAVVSNINNTSLDIDKVTERQYRGFKRNFALFEDTRMHFLSKESEILKILEAHKPLFNESKSYETAHDFISDFFAILKNDLRFQKEIVELAREK